jgi:hypothetical protein
VVVFCADDDVGFVELGAFDEGAALLPIDAGLDRPFTQEFAGDEIVGFAVLFDAADEAAHRLAGERAAQFFEERTEGGDFLEDLLAGQQGGVVVGKKVEIIAQHAQAEGFDATVDRGAAGDVDLAGAKRGVEQVYIELGVAHGGDLVVLAPGFVAVEPLGKPRGKTEQQRAPGQRTPDCDERAEDQRGASDGHAPRVADEG